MMGRCVWKLEEYSFLRWTKSQLKNNLRSVHTRGLAPNVPVNSKTAHPPSRANPGAFDFFKYFGQIPRYVASLDGQMPHPLELQRGSNPHPPRKPESLTFGNKFCKTFSHYEFLVQLVFAPHYKQRHISQYNYIKRQQQQNPRGIDKSNDPSTQLTCWIKEFQNPFVSDRWHTFWQESQMPHRAGLIWVKFPTVRSLTRVKCPGIARWGWAVLELTGT